MAGQTEALPLLDFQGLRTIPCAVVSTTMLDSLADTTVKSLIEDLDKKGVSKESCSKGLLLRNTVPSLEILQS